MIRIDNDRLEIADGGPTQMPWTVTGAEEIVVPPSLTPHPLPAATRGRWLRRLAWTVALLMMLLLLVVICVQLVLWSDYPRRYVVAELEQQLGLRVEAEKLSTTWWGETHLKNVALSLPLGQDAFVRVPQMTVRHTSLIPLLLQRPLVIDALTLNDPALVVRQDRLGRWDIVEVAELLGRVAGGQQADVATRGSTPVPPTVILPEITVHNGTLNLFPWNHEPVQVGNVQLLGRPSGRLLWLYEAAAGEKSAGQPYAAIKGEVSPGGSWGHSVQIDAQNLRPWLDAFAPWWPQDAKAELAWRGSVDKDRISGLLEIQSLQALEMQANGSMQVASTMREALLQPLMLTVDTPNPVMPRVVLRGGTFIATNQNVSARDLAITALRGNLHISADYAYNLGKGEARITCEHLQPADLASISGSANITLDRTVNDAAGPGAQSLFLDLQIRADTPAGLLVTAGELRASGTAWNKLTWDANMSRAAWSGWPAVELTQVTARGKVTPTQVELASVSARGPGTFSGTGSWNFADHSWAATLRAQDLPIVQTRDTAEVALDARGTPEAIHLQQATITASGITAQAAGDYVYALPKPLDLGVEFRETSLDTLAGRAVPATQPSLKEASTARSINLQGKIRGNARLNGTVSPLNLDIAGHLLARNVSVQDRSLGDADIALAGGLTEQEVHLATTEMDAFGGRWKIAAAYPFAARRATVTAKVDELSLARLGDALQWRIARNDAAKPMLGGVASGTITLETPGLNPADFRGTGLVMITNPEVQLASTGTPLGAKSLSAGIAIADGRVEVTPEVRQTAPPGTTAGEGILRGTIAVDLRTPERLDTRLHLENWTVVPPGNQAFANISADLEATADARTLTGTGKITTQGNVWYRGKAMGTIRADASLAGRIVDIFTLRADLLDGNLDGKGRINLDNLLASTLSLSWQNLDVKRLAFLHPALADAAGNFSGALVVEPDPSPRALGPLKTTLTLTNSNASYRGVPIGKASATGYASMNRLILDRSQVDVAGGRVSVWGRTIQREGYWSTNQLHVSLTSLDLNELVQAIRPGSEEMVGKLNGEIDALGDPRRPNALSGGGTIRIDQSDLANSDIVATIYSLMNIATIGRRADGQGRMTFQFEQGDAYITELYYFNRGVQLRGTGRVRRITDLPDSPIDVVVAGTARPLKELKLPVITDVDEIIGVLQSNVTTVRATGTLAEPQVVPVLLEQAGSDLKEILMGEVRTR